LRLSGKWLRYHEDIVHPPLFPDAVMGRNRTVSLRLRRGSEGNTVSVVWSQAINASKGEVAINSSEWSSFFDRFSGCHENQARMLSVVLIIIVGLPESAALEGVELSFRASESLDGLSYAHVGQAGAGIFFSSKIKPGGKRSAMLHPP
jgi:hypothetical protein